MRTILCLIFAGTLLISCDDGDIIVTDFAFENEELQWCGNSESQVLFNINNDLVNEAIAFRFDLDTPDPEFFSMEVGQMEIPLNNTNQIVYRVFNGEVDNAYFCSEIPPVAPGVTEEYRSTTGGEVIITTTLRTANDHDGDGVPSAQEDISGELDTDGDGIPNYLDIDDDGDNILTRVEIEVEAENNINERADSDNDGIPDFLDADDDNDGTPTKNEDWNLNLNPVDDQPDDDQNDDAGIPYYLNPEITDSFTVEGVRENTISSSFRYLVTIDNLTLVNQRGDGEQIRLQNYELGYYDSPSFNETLEPDSGEEDEDGEEDQ